MTIEPIYIAQTGDMKTHIQGADWFVSQIAKALERGCTLFRLSIDNVEAPALWKIEAWGESEIKDPWWQLSTEKIAKRYLPNVPKEVVKKLDSLIEDVSPPIEVWRWLSKITAISPDEKSATKLFWKLLKGYDRKAKRLPEITESTLA